MPRRTAKKTLASFFYDTSAPKSTGVMPKLKEYERNAEGVWIWKGPGEPTKPIPTTKKRKMSAKKQEWHETKQEIENLAKEMNKQFQDCEKILRDHPSWPLHDTVMQINGMIQKCKETLKDARIDAKGKSHKERIEAVHQTTIDISEWDIASIHGNIDEECKKTHFTNRLTLRPYNSSQSRPPYVNVVIQWLFTAKRLAMRAIERYIDTLSSKTDKMKQFNGRGMKGRQLRNQLQAMKKSIEKKHHKGEIKLADRSDAEHQYKEIHG